MTRDHEVLGSEFNDEPYKDMESQVKFILDSPVMSDWLKDALRNAIHRDPVAVLNDLEILNLVLRKRAMCMLDMPLK